MNLRPLGDRVLIRPEKNPETTASGLVVMAEQPKPDECGTVIAVGPCEHPLKAEAEALAREIQRLFFDTVLSQEDIDDRVGLIHRLVVREPSVKVGDFVLFSWASGQEILLDDERYLLMRESDILAVLEGVEA